MDMRLSILLTPNKMSKKPDAIKFIVKNYNWILLVAILILALNLRMYHLDYPVIGYHNMKESHTLMEARHFLEDGDYLTNRIDYMTRLSTPEGEHIDNFPLFTWLIAFVWKFTGVNVAVARFLTILFGLGSIFMTYLVTKELFKREDIALLSSFFLALMPFFIFFSRTVFFDVPALFCALTATYYFLLWKKKPKTSYFTWFVVFLTIAGLSKMVYLIILIPIATIFPYKRLLPDQIKKNYKQYLIGLILPISYFLYNSVRSDSAIGAGSVVSDMLDPSQVAEFFSMQYWKTIYLYATVDNFTTLGVLLMFLGLFISIFYIKKEANRFVAAWILSIVPYAFVVGWELRGHNYYQFPFAPVVAILIAFAFIFVFNSIIPKFKQKYLKPVLVIACSLGFFMLFMFSSFRESADRQFNQQFIGIDVAGQYVLENSNPDERIFGSGHQDSGIFWHAHRKGIKIRYNLTELKQYENDLNFRWVFIYQWEFANLQKYPEIWNYVKDNYQLRQVGLSMQGDEFALMYLLLEKGGKFNESQLNQYIQQNPSQSKQYELTNGAVEFLWVNV